MTTWSNQSKNSTTFSNISKTLLYSELLLENGDARLLENDDFLILELAGSGDTWANQSIT